MNSHVSINVSSYYQNKVGGQCNSLRKQNKLLRQMLLSVTEDDILDEVPLDEDPFQFESSQIHESKVNLCNYVSTMHMASYIFSVSFIFKITH